MDDADDHARSTRLLLAAPPVVGTQEWYDEGCWGATDRRDKEKGKPYADYISTESGPPWSTMSTRRSTCFFEKNFSKSNHCWLCVFTM